MIENTRKEFNQGTCKSLKTSPYLLVLFIDDNESKWNPKDIKDYLHNQVVPAKKFLETQARRYGINLDIPYGYYCTNSQVKVKYEGCIVKDLMSQPYTRDAMNQAVKSLGFQSKSKFHEYIQNYSKKSQVIYILAMNKDGRSFAMPQSMANESDHLEYCMCFVRYLNSNSNYTGAPIAHEILHLFGAEDYYDPYGKYPKRKILANKWCPKDIMNVVYSDISYNEINDFTAYTIGWLDKLPKRYDNPDWFK